MRRAGELGHTMQAARPVQAVTPAGLRDRDAELLARLRGGDDAAFARLVDEWSPAMLRLARTFVSNAQSAEDAVQDAWLAVLSGLAKFEGRSSLRTWAFTILVNRAKTRGVREARTRTVSWSESGADGDVAPAVDIRRFQGADGDYPGHWTAAGAPVPWSEQPERRALVGEVFELVERALQTLPPRQRLVATLRDVQGMPADEACAVLGISPQNQRVLLHRARSALRGVLEEYYRGSGRKPEKASLEAIPSAAPSS